MPVVEIKFPIAEQTIIVSRARAYKVRLKVEHWAIGDPGRGVLLALDDLPPRRVSALEVPLGDLLPTGQIIAAGEHRLFAVAVDAEGAAVKPATRRSRGPFGVVRFYVGWRARSEPEKPGLVLVAPTAPFAGAEPGARLLIDYFVFGHEPQRGTGPVHIALRGADGEFATDATNAVWVSGLGPGRYRLGVEVVGRQGVRAERAFELERAGVEEARP
jgi:hypothetical protein